MAKFEVTEIGIGGVTGRTLGVVEATSRADAVRILSTRMKLPRNIRVFPVQLQPGFRGRIVTKATPKIISKKKPPFRFVGKEQNISRFFK